ncbi:MAG: hypothetical protein ABII12_02205 [Planctomycetota bacterium]
MNMVDLCSKQKRVRSRDVCFVLSVCFLGLLISGCSGEETQNGEEEVARLIRKYNDLMAQAKTKEQALAGGREFRLPHSKVLDIKSEVIRLRHEAYYVHLEAKKMTHEGRRTKDQRTAKHWMIGSGIGLLLGLLFLVVSLVIAGIDRLRGKCGNRWWNSDGEGSSTSPPSCGIEPYTPPYEAPKPERRTTHPITGVETIHHD